MKNNTKVRLHLSKALFESLTKQVLAESKDMSGGAYTEVVKEKKNPKFDAFKQKSDQLPTGKQHQTKAAKANLDVKKANAERKIKEVDAMKDTKHMQKMEEKMSSKEKMAKGLYKEDLLSDAMPILLALSAGGGVLLAALARDIKNAKGDKETIKQILKNAAAQITQSKGIEESPLKEYEQHYKMVNGQCRRYNDEGEYDVVASHYCR